ncbi:hypothetical protein BCR41DRAFT_365226 [Lobosporangium transversale]|uniref:DUF6589 domain-containing protein n=1 Tax=Lobosporangium transversale TaxID=64571 RepID=A0A1Y2G5E9_9FUNG|nr:hypothetical protein BCR41DRAFT_365226 [Lobosporangium transversale]ORY95115.1 hypothetical protein BCR41DRAFT_365226 [Lobosporangium transversale]|eukprot:XP_021875322.1 hypothetical protein BCR41DRAFT_365226 [Lobosporangium transversale]
MASAAKVSKRYWVGATNMFLFIRDMVLYLELRAAIKGGDIGRIEEVLYSITIMFQANGRKNYGNELLKLAYGIRCLWSPELKKAIMRSWLINTSGRDDGWVPADMFQEHSNLLIKSVHAAKGSNMSWEYLAHSISRNIHLFSKVDSKIDSEFNLSFNSQADFEVSKEGDIQTVISELQHLAFLNMNRLMV